MTVAVYVHTCLQLSKYATDPIDIETKKVKRFINSLNPAYRKMVVAGQKPTLFDDAVDKGYAVEEVYKEKIAMNARTKRSGSSWFKKGGQFNNKKKKNVIRAKNKPFVRLVEKLIRLKLVGQTLGHV